MVELTVNAESRKIIVHDVRLGEGVSDLEILNPRGPVVFG